MCLPDFIKFEQIEESNPIIGYREWINNPNTNELKSTNQNYIWNPIEGPHEVKDKDSGIYAYNYYYNNNYYYYNYYNNNYYYYNYYNNNYNNYNNNNNYNNYNNNNYYYLSGIIHQWGKIAIHRTGQRSEYAKIITLFTIRESDAKESKNFIIWIKKFNQQVKEIAARYNANTIHWQDFIE